jgi:thiol-disulfide isomerase/thioredoxin
MLEMRRLFETLLLSLAVVLLPTFALCEIEISGTVRGADGKVPVLGHVHLMGFHGDLRSTASLIEMVTLSSAGKFEFRVEKPGMYRLGFTAVDHTKTTVPLLIDAETPSVKLKVQLEPIDYVDDFDTVRILGNWKGYSWEDADTMTARDDGSFLFEVETEEDTVAYELLDVTKRGHSVNGTHSDWHIYDGGGDYLSVVKTESGRAAITFDPKKVLRTDEKNLPRVEFGWRTRWMSKLTDIENLCEKHIEESKALEESEEETPDYDWTEAVGTLVERIQNERTLVVRQFAAIHIVQLVEMGAQLDSANAAAVAEVLPPESSMWELSPWSPASLAGELGEKAQLAMLNDMVKLSPVKEVRAFSLAELTSLAARRGDLESADTFYDQLKQDYSDIEYLIRRANPRKKIMVGKPVPDFSVSLMGDGGTVSKKSLAGKYYLLDFWATWCGPCRGEMKHLHKAHAGFGEKGLSIISLSFDRAPDDVLRYREGKWKMPWLHSFVTGGFGSGLATTFEVSGIPKPILVGPDGTILAVETELRGRNLKKTLAKHLGKQE